MTHITKEQLNHLAKLCRIQLSEEDVAELLPQLEQILTFVDQLKEVDVTGFELHNMKENEAHTAIRAGVVDSNFTEKFLANVQHPITNSAVTVTGKLSEH